MLIVGLGNYGTEYSNTRHNAGFVALDSIASHLGLSWSYDKRLKSEIALLSTPYLNEVILSKPRTYMNLSGNSVQAFLSYYRIPIEEMIVFHDDLDLPFCKVKAKVGGGSGGHKGLKSIDSCVGNAYFRIRIGIGRPIDLEENISDYVLGRFSPDETLKLTMLTKRITLNLETILRKDLVSLESLLNNLQN
jgi:PTH1 family peptidyl-tRNA hydrolase